MDQQQRSPNSEQQPASPLGSDIFRELGRFGSSSGDAVGNAGNDLLSPALLSVVPHGDRGSSQKNQSLDLSGQLGDSLLASTLEMHGTKRKSTESQAGVQVGTKRSSVTASHFPGFTMGSSSLGFSPVGMNSPPLLGNLGAMNHPLLLGGSSGSSFLQTPGQTLADLQTILPSAGSDLLRATAAGNGHLAAPSSSSLSTVFSAASNTTPLSSTSTATTSSSLPPYLMNPSMSGLLGTGYPLSYSQPLLSESRMFPSSLLSGSGGFPVLNPTSNSSNFLCSYNNPNSSLLGAALTQPGGHQSMENGGSSDDDVIEVTGQ